MINNKTSYSELNKKLFTEYIRGDISKRNEIIETNLGLVKLIINTYFPIYNMPYDDIFQEGCCALVEAVDKFNLKKGCEFSTYASIFIIGKIKNYLNKNKELYIPPNTLIQIAKYKKLKAKKLSDTEISVEMKVSLDKLEKIKENMQIIDNILVISTETKISNSNEDDDKDLTIGDLCTGSETTDVVIDNVFREELLQAMSKILTKKEMRVIYMKYGFNGNCMTEAAVARDLNTSRQNISNWEKTAIKKLRLRNSFRNFYEYNI